MNDSAPDRFPSSSHLVPPCAASTSNTAGTTIYFYANASGKTFQLDRQYAVVSDAGPWPLLYIIWPSQPPH